MYYALIHNKDVALKGFLRGCRPSRQNHVTLVFTMFLFYVSSSASILYHTQHGITTHCVANNNIFIFNMVSEPDFVLGIKQKFLASKEDSHVRNTDPQQLACLLSHLGLQHHATTTETPLLPRCYIFDLSSKSNHSPIKSMHIKRLLVETEPTDVLLGLPRGKPRNPVN